MGEKINLYREIKELLLKELSGEIVPGIIIATSLFLLVTMFLGSLYGHCLATARISEECERSIKLEIKAVHNKLQLLKYGNYQNNPTLDISDCLVPNENQNVEEDQNSKVDSE